MDINSLIRFVDKQRVRFICSVDQMGFSNIRAMLKPQKRDGMKVFYFSTSFVIE